MRRWVLPLLGLLLLGSLFSNGTAQTRKKKKTVVTKKTTPVAVFKPPVGPAPLAMDVANPRVFRFRGQSTFLIGASERYAAVQNKNFDYRKYLSAVAEDHLNLVRIINGTYVEADDLGSYLAPWPKTAAGSYDLTQFEPTYFERLRAFVSEAGLRDIVVDVTLFSTMYGSGKGYGAWAQSPFNTAKLNWDRFNTLEDASLTNAQDALVRKTVAELNGLDNFYFTVCNECKYSGATAKETSAWVDHITATLRDAEPKLPNRHLISDASPLFQTPGITAAPCKALDLRRDAWTRLFSIGGTFLTLDPSLTANAPEEPSCKEARIQLGILRNFVTQSNLVKMKPAPDALRQWALGASDAWTLTDDGRTYAVYLRSRGVEIRKSVLLLDLPAGKWQLDWFNPRTGDQDKAEPIEHTGGSLRIVTPGYTEDLAMRLALQPSPPAAVPAGAGKADPAKKTAGR